MSFLRRLTAALSSALLLQLTLLGSGPLRSGPFPGAGGAGGSAEQMMVTMHGASAMANSSTSESMPGDEPGMPPGCDMSGNGTDCHLPSAPGMCASSATCAAPVVPAVIAVLPLAAPSDAAVLPEPTRFSSGPASAPELPPPRA